MLHTKFQASKPSGSDEEDFFYFAMYFYGLNQGPPGKEPSWILGPSFAIYPISSILAKLSKKLLSIFNRSSRYREAEMKASITSDWLASERDRMKSLS